MKYRKTALIEAVQFNPGGDHKMQLPDGVIVAKSPSHADNYNYHGFEFACQTLEGDLVVVPGDWIATGIKGEHWPIKPDIFEATYELAE